MLYRPSALPGTTPPDAGQASKKIWGKRLSRKLKAISLSHRALLAADLAAGRVDVSHFTVVQAAAMTNVSVGYACTAGKLPAEQRKLVERNEVSLSAFHNKPATVTDAMIHKFIAKAGAGRVLDALDQLTAPTTLSSVAA
jgi:hypothetical protein